MTYILPLLMNTHILSKEVHYYLVNILKYILRVLGMKIKIKLRISIKPKIIFFLKIIIDLKNL